MGQRGQAEMAGQGLADIGKAIAYAERHWPHIRAKSQHRYISACVIAAGPGWITAMVRRDDGKVAGAQAGFELG